MRVATEKIKLPPTIEPKMLDITKEVQAELDKSGMKEGNVTVFVTGSTAAITTLEFEPGLQTDMREALDRVFPKGVYHHETNGFSHVRASFVNYQPLKGLASCS